MRFHFAPGQGAAGYFDHRSQTARIFSLSGLVSMRTTRPKWSFGRYVPSTAECNLVAVRGVVSTTGNATRQG
ncbi:protein of unknown function [Cupriavidus taiwanensis]|nr:protein of unknown function [Cupriavidus taiwanensis]